MKIFPQISRITDRKEHILWVDKKMFSFSLVISSLTEVKLFWLFISTVNSIYAHLHKTDRQRELYKKLCCLTNVLITFCTHVRCTRAAAWPGLGAAPPAPRPGHPRQPTILIQFWCENIVKCWQKVEKTSFFNFEAA